MASSLSFLLPCLQVYSTTRALQATLRKEGFECPVEPYKLRCKRKAFSARWVIQTIRIIFLCRLSFRVIVGAIKELSRLSALSIGSSHYFCIVMAIDTCITLQTWATGFLSSNT